MLICSLNEPSTLSASEIEKACVSRRVRSSRISATSGGSVDSLLAGDLVREVFALGKVGGQLVGCLVGDGVDGRAADVVLLQRIGMQGDEEAGMVLAGDLHALGKRQEFVLARASGTP